jgi:hypothetical protein
LRDDLFLSVTVQIHRFDTRIGRQFAHLVVRNVLKHLLVMGVHRVMKTIENKCQQVLTLLLRETLAVAIVCS